MPSIVQNLIVHHGFRYQKNRERNNAIYWSCLRSDCRNSMQTYVFDVEDETAVIQILQPVLPSPDLDGWKKQDNGMWNPFWTISAEAGSSLQELARKVVEDSARILNPLPVYSFMQVWWRYTRWTTENRVYRHKQDE
ncbi:Hypothetical predicted protein [Mytilus galloprovincialis]|uniref:FLYWCH-type domain-containing protein n=1 Tax=Mytilus galloprovincialis TaxID=29158 RepID=A0A8B6EK58_MYTGA|nr:Hypothetical predicted protein [Mytilus galloprovincialis]